VGAPAAGSVALVTFPFSDLSEARLRVGFHAVSRLSVRPVPLSSSDPHAARAPRSDHPGTEGEPGNGRRTRAPGDRRVWAGRNAPPDREAGKPSETWRGLAATPGVAGDQRQTRSLSSEPQTDIISGNWKVPRYLADGSPAIRRSSPPLSALAVPVGSVVRIGSPYRQGGHAVRRKRSSLTTLYEEGRT
jgi:hypothetical protein